MSDREDEQQIEDDPRIANIYRRMRMLVGVSLGVMVVGFLVVIGVIVYRLSTRPPVTETATVTGLGLPADARLISLAAEDGKLFVSVESGGRGRVIVLDAETLKEVGQIVLGPTPPPASVPLPAAPAN